jgi:selenocysteine lyase/cysteine desulfurase
MLTCQKSAFQLPAEQHYLNCAYMSPMPRAVEEAGIEGIRRKRNPALIAPADFFTEADRARALFGRLIGADGTRVAIVPAVSYGMALVARNIPLARDQNVVVAREQFPSNVHVWRAACRAAGAELRTVEAPDSRARGQAWNERLAGAIDSATAVVALPHVHWTDGTIFDLVALGARARGVGAALVVDGTQSVGAMHFDTADVRPDAVVVAAYKWLLGPYSIGLAYLGPRFDSGAPLEETWLGRAGSEDFGGLVDYRDEYQPGAARFDVGQRSNFALLPMLIAALEQLLAWDVRAISTYCATLTASLIADAREQGYAMEDDEWRAPHLFGLRPPAGVALSDLHARLAARKVIVSLRGSALRISPHVYNDDEDISALRAALSVRAAGAAGARRE